jgi:hypothetical protein
MSGGLSDLYEHERARKKTVDEGLLNLQTSVLERASPTRRESGMGSTLLRNLSIGNKLSAAGGSRSPESATRSLSVTSRATPTAGGGGRIHEKLSVNIEDGSVRRPTAGASPTSTRRANLQSFIFGKDAPAPKVANEEGEGAIEGAIAGGERDDDGAAPRTQLEQQLPPSPARAPNGETLEERQKKLETLKVLQEHKREIQAEVTKLAKQLTELEEEHAKEEELGSRRQMQLRQELERITNAVC